MFFHPLPLNSSHRENLALGQQRNARKREERHASASFLRPRPPRLSHWLRVPADCSCTLHFFFHPLPFTEKSGFPPRDADLLILDLLLQADPI